jgi:hypothetical protein
MKQLSSLILSFLITLFFITPSQAQTGKILALDTIIGAVNGSGLGLATMAIADNNDYGPLRVGFGAGTLYGLGLGIYDVSQQAGSGYMVSGAIGSASNTAQIVAMDTFYGGLTGGVVGFAISLIGNTDMVKGLQYGAGYGTWAGFGFGLIDAFVISKQSGYDFSDDDGDFDYGPRPMAANGMIQFNGTSTQVGFLSGSSISVIKKGRIVTYPTLSISSLSVNF